MRDLLVEMTGITKDFPGVHALADAGFELRPGEVHALVGENGAGKSTLMKILAGVYQPDAGEIRFKGEPVEIANPRTALDLGISMIHQELNLAPHLTVAQNIFLGREPRGRPRFLLDDRRLNRQTQELIERLHLKLDPRARVGDLKIAQQQMVEIAKALSLNAAVLVMDEPTAALTDTEIDELFRIIRDLRANGVGVVHISHRLEELKQISDRVTVMRDGRYVATLETADAEIPVVINMMVGRTIYEAAPEIPERSDEVVLEVRGLTRGRMVRDVSFVLHKGEILGVAGLVGAGRTEVVRAIFGADRPDSGEIQVHGRRVDIHSPADAVDARHRLSLGGSQALRPGARHERRDQHRARLAEPVHVVVRPHRHPPNASGGGAARAGSRHQDPERPPARPQPVGRNPAEGRHRQVADR